MGLKESFDFVVVVREGSRFKVQGVMVGVDCQLQDQSNVGISGASCDGVHDELIGRYIICNPRTVVSNHRKFIYHKNTTQPYPEYSLSHTIDA